MVKNLFGSYGILQARNEGGAFGAFAPTNFQNIV